ncbi:MAG: hypothetical protein ABFS46_07225 [Myxococcota bacterium]
MELRSERLRASYRFTFAFHAREVRFERDTGAGPEPIFPEVYSFHADRHDPAELLLQLEDLWTNPRLLAPGATRRDAEELLGRLLLALPRYLETLLARLAGEDEALYERVCEDLAVLLEVVRRFIRDKGLEEQTRLRLASFHLSKLLLRALTVVLRARVRPEFLEAYVAGRVETPAPGQAGGPFGAFYAIAAGDADATDVRVTAAAERAFHRWLDGVCLDEENQAFEGEASPFEDREREVLRAVSRDGGLRVSRGRDFTPFLRRARNRDCARLLQKLEIWFLRRYDVGHAAAVIHHASHLERGEDDAERVLSRHSTRNYFGLLALLLFPLAGAAFFYDRAPLLFDVAASAQIAVLNAVAFWFLIYKFCWKKDLTFFHAAVPRIGAGIIVGYLPVFLIDEVWDLASRPWFPLGVVILMLGFTTLLYLYVEVHRRIADPQEAFARTRALFLLGLVEAGGFGLLVTSLLGPFMVVRNWSEAGVEVSMEVLRATTPPFLGELPRILGLEPLLLFPTAVVLMSFLAFFIGTFLQLLWEELPITEPL